MNPLYLFLRLIRRILPRPVIRSLLQRGFIIHPGLETRDPKAAALRHRNVLAQENIGLEGKSVLVFGYGGRFAMALELIKLGAGSIILNDKYAVPDDRSNRELLPEWGRYLVRQAGHILPNPEFIRLSNADIREADLPAVDIVLTTSVFEHLDDVDAITRSLSALTKAGGAQLHFIDLRDHYFRNPFEMLCYPRNVWEKWLNPTSNLNRYRMPDYRRAFEKYFGRVEIEVLERDEQDFQRMRSRIRPEFLTGDDEIDSVTLIRVLVTGPRPRQTKAKS